MEPDFDALVFVEQKSLQGRGMTRNEIKAKAATRRALVLDLRKTRSLKWIAAELGITEARVWQIEQQALKTLQTKDIQSVAIGA